MNLLDVYDGMVKSAEEEIVLDERREMIAKYAAFATEKLSEKYDDFTPEEVKDLTVALIEHDTSVEEAQEKVADYVQAGQIMARSYLDELDKASENKE